MIEYEYEACKPAVNEVEYTDWLNRVAESEGYTIGELCFIFMLDEALLEINRQYLNHDYYTDIITFDYTEGKRISGDVMISVDRVKENAEEFGVSMEMELKRVMVHGVLHLMGYKDKSEDEASEMRVKENSKINMFHVEQ